MMRRYRLIIKRLNKHLKIIFTIFFRDEIFLNYQMGKVGSSSISEYFRLKGARDGGE